MTGVVIPGTVMTVLGWALFLWLQRALYIPVLRLSAGWRWGLGLLFLLDALFTIIWSERMLAAAREAKELATTGPYAIVRHPMYGALLWSGTAAVAFGLQTWLVLLAVVPLHLGWIWLVRAEEEELTHRFGSIYHRYAAETGQFLPRISSLKRALRDTSDQDL